MSHFQTTPFTNRLQLSRRLHQVALLPSLCSAAMVQHAQLRRFYSLTEARIAMAFPAVTLDWACGVKKGKAGQIVGTTFEVDSSFDLDCMLVPPPALAQMFAVAVQRATFDSSVGAGIFGYSSKQAGLSIIYGEISPLDPEVALVVWRRSRLFRQFACLDNTVHRTAGQPYASTSTKGLI